MWHRFLQKHLQSVILYHCPAKRIKVFTVHLPDLVEDLQVDLFVFTHEPAFAYTLEVPNWNIKFLSHSLSLDSKG